MTYRFTAQEDGDTSLLDDGVSEVPLAIAMPDWAGAAHPTLGTQAPTGGLQERRDASPQAMRIRRETVEHPFGTTKARARRTDEDPTRRSL